MKIQKFTLKDINILTENTFECNSKEYYTSRSQTFRIKLMKERGVAKEISVPCWKTGKV